MIFRRRQVPLVGYLFERFPSFTQTFCAREVAAMRKLGFEGPVFSVRDRSGEEPDQCYEGLGQTTYLPEGFDAVLANDTQFRREARHWLAKLRDVWGSEAEKRRIYESLWLRRQCATQSVTHLHTHFAGLAARTAFWLHRQGGPTYSVTAHANDIFRDEPPERLAQVLGAASCVVTVSDFSARFLAKQIPALQGRLHRVYNGIDMARFRKSCFPADRPLALAVGRSIEKKGFSDLIEACTLLGDLDFECRIVGGGPLDAQLRSQVQAANLTGKVHIDGPRAEAEIITLLARAHLFVLPCVTASDGAMDNLPTVIMEAMSAALPVISTPVAGIPEMIDDARTGFLVPEHSPQALAARMRELLTSAETARTLGMAGYDKCSDLFAIERTSNALASIWREHKVA